jgi:hypothetical protein
MALRIVPYGESAVEGARALNGRLRAQDRGEFLLGESAPVPDPEDALIRRENYVALDGDTVRGGFLLVRYPGVWRHGESGTVLNWRDPISEGSTVALHILRHVLRENPYVFCMGMGGIQSRFAQFLKGAGWNVSLVPFMFHVVRVPRFLQELRMLQASRGRRVAARLAAFSGTGKLGLTLLQARSLGGMLARRGFELEPVREWGPWADDLWERFRGLCSFAVERNRAGMQALYPLGDGRTNAYLVRRAGQPVGCIAALNTAMSNHKFFGNLRVATILDCIADADAMRATVALATQALARDGADLIVTNQQHNLWVRSFRQMGYLSSASNYVLALSKPLAAVVGQENQGFERIHFTRGDGDGRMHL